MESIESYLLASNKTASLLASMVDADGGLKSDEITADLCYYYKLPTLMLLSGHLKEANNVLDYIKNKFLQPNGDLHSNKGNGPKTKNGALCEYHSYTNGWVVMGASRCGRFDLVAPMCKYLKEFYNPHLGGFTTNAPYKSGNKTVDTLTCAHMGLLALYQNDLETATKVGDLLCQFVAKQPDLSQGFYLRMDSSGQIITQFPTEASIFHIVSKPDANQAYFFIGYPVLFFGKLFLATGKDCYLEAAKSVLDFCLTCNDGIYSFHFAHKVARGASLVASLTKDEKYVKLSRRIADYLCTLQNDDGLFLADADPQDKFDQSVEIAIWLREIHSDLADL